MFITLFVGGKGQVFKNILTRDSLVGFFFIFGQSFSHPENCVVVIAIVVRLSAKLKAITSYKKK